MEEEARLTEEFCKPSCHAPAVANSESSPKPGQELDFGREPGPLLSTTLR